MLYSQVAISGLKTLDSQPSLIFSIVASMDLVLQIVNEMKDTGAFFQSRQAVVGLAAGANDTIAGKPTNSMVHQINNLPELKVDGAKQLNEALSQSGYTSQGKQQIMAAIEAMLGCAPGHGTDSKLHRWNCLWDGMPFYVTRRDVCGLDSCKPLLNKI